MKKTLLTFASALLCLGAMAQETIENLNTGAKYSVMSEAFNAAKTGEVIQVNEDTEMSTSTRCTSTTANFEYTIQGKEYGITLKKRNSQNNSFFLANKGNVTINFKDLIFDGENNGVGASLFAIEAGGDVLSFENVEVKNFKSDVATYINLKNNNTYTLNFKNTKFTNCLFTNKAGTENLANVVVKSNTTVNLSGDNSMTIFYEGAGTVNVVGELTNETPIQLIVDNIVGQVAVKGYTDASKFSVTNPELELAAMEGNLVVKSKSAVDPVFVQTDIVASGVSNTGFYSLQSAVNAVVTYNGNTENTEKIGTATIILAENQTITKRLQFTGANYVLKPAENAEVSIAAAAGDIAFMINANKTVTIENMTITGVEGSNMTKNQVEVSGKGSELTLKNVIIKSLNVSGTYLIQAKGDGHLIVDNVNVIDCDNATAFAFIGSNGSSVTGNSNTSFIIERNNSINGEGWTPQDVIDITLQGTREVNKDLILNFTDASKLNLTNDGWYLAASQDGKNLIATDVNTGVDEVGVDENAPVEYYNLQGVRVENPANGLYIKRQGSKVEKVIVR